MTNEAAPLSTTQPSDSAAWLTTGRFTLFLAALIFVAYPQVVTGFHSFVWRDYGLFGYPLAYYHKECFWRGEIPLWNPYNNFGLPYLAQWGTMVLYPPSLIYLLLPLPWSLALFTLLHQLLGGVGMFVLARRWTGDSLAGGIAGIAFAFHGFMLNCVMWPNQMASMAWMPWVVLAVTAAWREGGKQIFVAAAAAVMQMLSGTPEIILITWFLLAGLWLVENWGSWRKRCLGGLRVGVVIVLVAAAAAAQLLPFLELVAQSNRSSSFDTGRWPIPPSGWANLFVPLYRMHGTGAGVYFQSDQNLTTSYYAGVAIVVAGLLALAWARDRRVCLFFGVSIVVFVFAMGNYTPFYGWLRKAVPALGFMRYPAKGVIPTAFTFPVLAAFGIAALMAMRDPERQKRRNYVVFALLGGVILAMIGIVVHAHWVPYRDVSIQPVIINASCRAAFLIAIAVGCWWLTRSVPIRRRRLLQTFVLMMVYFDLLTHVPQQNPTVDREALTVAIPWVKHMNPRPTLGQSRALISLTALEQYLYSGTSNLTQTYIVQRNGLFSNLNLPDRMPKADGFYALYIKEERDIHYRLFQTGDEARPALGRFLGFCQVTAPTNVVVWNARTNYLPWVTAGQTPIFANRETTLEALIATNFTPERVVYLPAQASNEVQVVTGGAAKITSCEVTPHRISADVSATAPSLVVIAQVHYPRWKAFVDGRPTQLLRANHAFQAVQVPAGDHRVNVVYQDTPFQIGAAISLFGVVGIAAGWASRTRRCTKSALNQDTAASGKDSERELATCLPHTTA